MTWTYSAATLAGSDLYKVRLIIGDTDTTRQQLQDEEITYALSVETSPTMAAAVCCDYLAGKYSYQMNTENGSLRISAERRMSHYVNLADRLRKGGPGNTPGDAIVVNATMYVGGSSNAAKAAILNDSDNNPGPFRIGEDDNPANPQPLTPVSVASDGSVP